MNEKLPDAQYHKEGNIYVMDDVISKDEFLEQVNFSGMFFFDKNTKAVLAFCMRGYHMDLINCYETESTIGCSIYYKNPNIMEILSDFKQVGGGWDIELNLRSLSHSRLFVMRVDTGATFSVIPISTLTEMLALSSDEDTMKILYEKRANAVKASTALGTVEYYPICLMTELFNKQIRMRIYVDITNKLPRPLFGFDMIQAINFINKPGSKPVLLGFDREAHKKFHKEHPETECQVIDIYNMF